MRVGIIGAGAVGGTLAALLDRAGHTVEVTARGAHLDAIVSGGIRLTGAWGEHVAHVAAGERLTLACELVIVATKAQDAATALADNLAIVEGTDVLVVQNGLGGVATARTLSPSSRVVGALALFAASYLSPGAVTVTGPGVTVLGTTEADGGPDAATLAIADLLSPVLPVAVTDDFAGAQWTKLVVNQINALPAITGLSAQQVIADRGLRRIMTASMREAVRVGLAAGVRFGTLQGLSRARLRLFAALPLWAGQTLPRVLARRMGATPNPGSTLQSIRRGQGTEIDHLNGAIVAAARAADVAAPVNAALVALVHEVEETGAFLTPAQVADRVR